MRAKFLPLTILMSTAMCGGVFAFTISQAQAETFSAQGNWAISKATGQQQNATPYCALARRFGNGSVLTFARNSFEETSVAIDFPKGTFKTGKEYTITFDAGQGQRRSFDTQPVSERGVVVRMGRDEKFYSALEQSGSLGINVNDKAYVFAMPDVKDGTQELAACLGATVEPAAGAAPAPAAPMKEAAVAPAPKMSEVASRVMKAESKVESAPAQMVASMSAPVMAASDSALQNMQEENIRLKNALERERRVYEEKMQQGANTSAAAEMTEKLRLLETENRELKSQVGTKIASATAPAAIDPQLSALKDANARLKMDSQSQLEKIAALESAQKMASTSKTMEADAQMSGLKDQISKLQTENGSLKNTLVQNEAAKPTPSEVAALKDENTRLKMDVQSQQQKIAALDASQKTAVIAKSAEADTQLAGMKDQISKLQAENGTLKNSLAQNQVAKSDQSVLAALQEENTRLKANVESQQQKIAALEAAQKTVVAAKSSAADAELAGLKEQVSKLQVENTTLKTTVTQNQTAQSQVAKAESAELAALKDENGRLKTDVQSQQQKVAALEASQKSTLTAKSSEADAQLASVKAELSKIQAENTVLKNTVAQSQAQIASSQQGMKESVSAISKMKALEVQLASAQSERDRLLKEVTGMKNADADGRVKISSDNWNLEQSTRRFNEAELEIRRLGASMEQERAKCAVEKKDLEYMLFDPKIAEKQQIAKLLSLEEELAQTKQALEKSGGVTMAQASGSIPPVFAALKPVAVEKQALGKKDHVSANELADITPAAGGNAATGAISRDPVMPVMKESVAANTAPVAVPSPVKAAATIPAGSVSSAPAVLVSAPVAVPVPAMVAAAVPSAPKAKMMAASDVESILRQAGISMSGHVQPAPTTGGANQVAYRWETDELFGTAEQKTIQSSTQFDSFISEYLKKTESRCTGEFASSPAMYETDGSNRLAAYEIACVDTDGAGASAALVFESKDGIFTSIAHESASDSMDAAMTMRDKVITVLQNSKTASR